MPTPAFALSRRALLLALTVPAGLRADTIDEAVQQLQHDWDVIRYQTPATQRDKRYQALASRAHALAAAHAGRAEPVLWEGIALASLADERGRFGGLGLARQAKRLYEEAIRLAPDAPDGAAYQGLGALYAAVPGWPLGFGDRRRAEALMHAALDRNPQGLDANVAYGALLLAEHRPADALPYLERALQAPGRPGRQIADAGRREEARQLIAQARAQLAR